MRLRDFRQVDVFTAVPLRGNPLAVVMDGTGLDDATLQRFAQWTNLSETTFLLPPTAPGADYRVRIFTPGGELPFAGHPTLGSCHAWLEAGGRPREPGRIVQECAVGLVALVRRDDGALAFEAPPVKRSTPDAALLAQVREALGLQPQELLAAQSLDNGPVWLGLLLDTPATVLRLAPDHARLKALGTKVGVAARHAAPGPDGLDLEVRAFAAPIGIPEDPVTGSLNASLAQWLVDDGHLPAAYRAGQGRCLGRDGRVQLTRDAAGHTWVGGHSVTCITGQVRL
ncbi:MULTISPECIES: PhzF family phenazine biosynthesis protein [Ramlibacter]|uniref:PhzF family phenazine biosynthesis protein n=1 Tax=Ramlibacter aquaticus TaxID=2780094 RepID=A0ABR9SDW3_9BURK|nr:MULTISPECIES: PhzF family phenazine biosynthesis protein [Ramlibacter]MBE7940539.1 PhzF family phenazine biosynthesis protein [Ramlibacter aquaticus]